MKKKMILTTALALAILAAPAAIPTAADGAATVYPKEFIGNLQFTSLTDYAIYGDSYAFAEGTKLYLITSDENGDRQLNSRDGFDCSVEINNLEYDNAGDLFIGNAEGKTYKYPDLSQTVEFRFTETITLQDGDYNYYLRSGKLDCVNSADESKDTSLGTGYAKLKQYGSKIYVIKENVLYTLSQATLTAVQLEFTDFSAAANISTGNAKSVIQGDYTLKKVKVMPVTAAGGDTFCTEIDLSDLSKPYFTAGRTIKLTMERTALCLGETGNASIIIMLDENGETKSYLTLTSALEDLEDVISVSPDLEKAHILERTKLYSRPFMSGSTEIATLEKGETVNVTEKLNLDFADGKISYYKISLERDGQTVEGYIAANYLTPYSFTDGNKQPETVKDGDGYDTNLRVVLIILMIIALVLIAAGYLTFILTKNKENKKRSRAREHALENQDKDFLN